MIELQDIQFHYREGSFRMNLPRFTVDSGTLTSLRGQSGGGKTTLLNLIAGILLPLEGDIRIDGTVISTLNESERRSFRLTRIGSVFQDFELLGYLNIYDNIRLASLLGQKSIPAEEIDSRVRELAERAGIASHLNRFPAHLSKGEQQRTALCRALLGRPSLILADEATGNLDPQNKEILWEMVREYCRDTGTTVLAATHDESIQNFFDVEKDLEDLLE